MKINKVPPIFNIPSTFGIQEIIKIAALFAATCLAGKIEDIIKELADNDNEPFKHVIEDIKYEQEEV